MRTPPRLALYLLQLLVPASDSLAGDAVEQFRLGRSRWWLWRQVVGAIAHAANCELAIHPIVTLRSVVIGWLFLWIGTRSLFAVLSLPEWLFATGIAPAPFRNGIASPG